MKAWFTGEDKNGTSSATTLCRFRTVWSFHRDVYSFRFGCRSLGCISPWGGDAAGDDYRDGDHFSRRCGTAAVDPAAPDAGPWHDQQRDLYRSGGGRQHGAYPGTGFASCSNRFPGVGHRDERDCDKHVHRSRFRARPARRSDDRHSRPAGVVHSQRAYLN